MIKKKTARKARVQAVAIPAELDINQPRHTSILRVVGHPLHLLAERLHIATDGRMEKKNLRYFIGGAMMVTGSSMAVSASMFHISHVIHICVDLVAYAVHGCGAVPYITHVVRHFDLEG